MDKAFLEWSLFKPRRPGEDLVGDILIGDGTSQITARSVYLDSWLEKLIFGLEAIRAGAEQISIDLIEEPDPLFFRRLDTSLQVSFRDRSLMFESADRLEELVRGAAGALLQQADTEGSYSEELLARIRRFTSA